MGHYAAEMSPLAPFITKERISSDDSRWAKSSACLTQDGLAHHKVLDVIKCHVTEDASRIWYEIYYEVAGNPDTRYVHSVAYARM
jgi:hypothetical protein